MKTTQTELKKLFDITHKNPKNTVELYKRLIQEEYLELMDEEPNTANDFKELCDLIWVCIQYANANGYDLEKGIEAIKHEYVSKFLDAHGIFNPKYNEFGKLMKGEGFKKADFTKLL